MWIELHDTLLDHRKVKRLSRAVTRQAVTVRGHLVTLWLNVLRHAPDGNLIDWEPSDIEDYAEWDGPPGAFVDALIACGFLVHGKDEAIAVNDWTEYATHLKAAERKRKERERKRFEAEDTVPESHDVTGRHVTSQDSDRNSGPVTLTRPDQTRTDQTRPDQTKPNTPPLADASSPAAPPGGALVPVGDRPIGKPVPPHHADIAAAYAHWREQHPRAPESIKTTGDGFKKAAARLKEGRTLLDLIAAIDGMHATPWYVENNQTAFEMAMRPDKFLMFLENNTAPPQTLTPKDRAMRNAYQRAVSGAPGMFDGVLDAG